MFRGGDGNLYKEAWPSLTGASDSEYEEYMMERLRTNSGKDSWDGEGANVQRMVDFGKAVEAAADDYELTKTVQVMIVMRLEASPTL